MEHGGQQPGSSGELSARILGQAAAVVAASTWEDDGLNHLRQHVHWLISSSQYPPDANGNQPGGTQHDLMAPNRETALALARATAPPEHQVFILRQVIQHHPHAEGAR